MPEVRQLAAVTGAEEISFPMCEVGHPSQKLTTLLVTSGMADTLRGLRELRCYHKTHQQVRGIRSNGAFTSARASRYPSQFNALVVKAITDLEDKRVDGPDGSGPIVTCPRDQSDPNWIIGWEVRQGPHGTQRREAIVDPDELSFP